MYVMTNTCRERERKRNKVKDREREEKKTERERVRVRERCLEASCNRPSCVVEHKPTLTLSQLSVGVC